ncbi:endonuclease domain-containing 1 -like, partial [Paramuricea clavata]
MKLLLRFLVLFLSAEKQKIYSEVVLDYSKCQKFFYKSAPPEIGFLNQPELDLAHICQKLGSVYHFGTLYSKYWRIPIYSAYELLDPQNSLTGPTGDLIVIKECTSVQKSRGTWFFEPQ